MNSEISKTDGHNKELTITIPTDHYQATLENVYSDLRKEAVVKGFRKGKVPMDMIRQQYGDAAQKESMEKLIREAFEKAIQEHSLKPVEGPEIEITNFGGDQDVKFRASFECLPEIELKNYKNFSFKLEEINVEDKEVEEVYDRIRDQFSSFEDLPEFNSVQDDTVAKMVFTAKENGEVIEGMSDQEASLEIGKDYMPKVFEDEIKGLRKGDHKNFSVTYEKEADQNHPMAGKTIEYSVRILAVQKKKLGEITDENVSKLGPFKTVLDLRTQVREDLKRQKIDQQKTQFRDQLMERLLDDHEVVVPESMLKKQVAHLAHQTAQRLESNGLKAEEIESKLKEWAGDFENQAKKQVQGSLLLSCISEKENIQADETDIRKEVMSMVSMTGKKPEDLYKELQEKSLIGPMVQQITEAKTLSWLLDQSLKGSGI